MKNYELLNNGCMVSAIDPHAPQKSGIVWRPNNKEENDEAVALSHVGYAKETTKQPTVQTRSQLENGDTAAKEPKISGVKETGIRQEDGTFKNKAGVRVHKDGSEFMEGDEAIIATLDKPADDLIAALKGELSDEQRAILPRLAEVEASNKGRKTVLEAVNAVLQPKSE